MHFGDGCLEVWRIFDSGISRRDRGLGICISNVGISDGYSNYRSSCSQQPRPKIAALGFSSQFIPLGIGPNERDMGEFVVKILPGLE